MGHQNRGMPLWSEIKDCRWIHERAMPQVLQGAQAAVGIGAIGRIR